MGRPWGTEPSSDTSQLQPTFPLEASQVLWGEDLGANWFGGPFQRSPLVFLLSIVGGQITCYFQVSLISVQKRKPRVFLGAFSLSLCWSCCVSLHSLLHGECVWKTETAVLSGSQSQRKALSELGSQKLWGCALFFRTTPQLLTC